MSQIIPYETRSTVPFVLMTDNRFRGCASLHHLLSTLHDGRYRTPCKTRFRLAGCAFAGRESNPLDLYERFQVISSSSPGLSLAQYPFGQAVESSGWRVSSTKPIAASTGSRVCREETRTR